MSKSPKRIGSSPKSHKTAEAGKVLGTTADGVRILKPKGKATHFSARELQAAIVNARSARSGR